MKNLENELFTSVTEVNNRIIVSIPSEMTDDDIMILAEMITSKVYHFNYEGVVLNFSIVRVMDLYTYTSFVNITKSLHLMGARTVWVGLRPGVVSALMDLNVEFNSNNILTAISIEEGLHLISKNSF